MFDPEELAPCLEAKWFRTGYSALERMMLAARLEAEEDEIVLHGGQLLSRFTEAVMASAPGWTNPREGLSRTLCLLAGDIETGLGIHRRKIGDDSHAHFFRAALLYDLGGMPGSAASVARRNGLDHRLKDYFGRTPGSLWNKLLPEADIGERTPASEEPDASTGVDELLEDALSEVAVEEGLSIQHGETERGEVPGLLAMIGDQVGRYSVDLNSSDVAAFARTLTLRSENSSLLTLNRTSKLTAKITRSISLPLELWPVQQEAINTGLFEPEIINYGLAAPTGTGKTALTRALIADSLQRDRERKIAYISPSRALVHQIAADLRDALTPAGYIVHELGAHLTVHEQLDFPGGSAADVIVFTPERADLLLRVDPEFIQSIGLVIVDEAHHIEQGARGILLEFYLWRMRQLIPADARVIQLSAVTPNIDELVGWLGDGKQTQSVKLDWRSSRLRIGVFERKADGAGILQLGTTAPFTLFEPGTVPEDRTDGIAKLADSLSHSGVVLVLCTSPTRAEAVAEAISALRHVRVKTEDFSPSLERVDARVERELFPASPLRSHLQKGVVYHHARLPPRVRAAVEGAIACREADIVCATTTLAEGVNFPFSTVVVEALWTKDYQISPRSLWNIAGRAGRFGVDSEGHCIIYEPSAYEKKLTPYKLSDYLQTKLDDIPPVRSALGEALTELKGTLDRSELAPAALEQVSLAGVVIDGKPQSQRSKKLRGLVNLVRVGLAHANTSGLIGLNDTSSPELVEDTLAAKQAAPEAREFAKAFGVQQRKVIGGAFAGDSALMTIASRVGWSLETQSELHQWLKSLADWQLEKFGRIALGGRVLDSAQLGYLLGPVSKHMSEAEGTKLGGMSAFVSRYWIEGLPFTAIRDNQREKDVGRLVQLIYQRVQYLLPWALYGVNELIAYEAKQRSISVQDGVHQLSVLAAEGVPNYEALSLVMRLNIERVDATRIAASYLRHSRTTDVVGFLMGLEWPTLVGIVRDVDRRRLDPDLRGIWEGLRASGGAS